MTLSGVLFGQGSHPSFFAMSLSFGFLNQKKDDKIRFIELVLSHQADNQISL
jgi:hypothetical protein